MAAEWALSYLAIFLQVLTAFVLFNIRSPQRSALRIFAWMFLLNAGVSAIMTLPREYAVWLAADQGALTRAFRALDAPTGFFLLAFAAARSTLPRARELAWTAVATGVVTGLLEFPFHPTMVEWQWLFRALPLYAGLSLAAYLCAVGEPWERWIALALLPRMLYWGTSGVISVATEGLGDEINVYANRLGLLALLAVALVASARLLRQDGMPFPSVALPILLIGPALALLEVALSMSLSPEDDFWFGSIVLVNLVTLGFVRPVVTLGGLAPQALRPIFGRAALAAGLGAASTLLVRFDFPATGPTSLDLAVGEAISFGFGLSVGLLVLAMLQIAVAARAPKEEPPAVAEPDPWLRGAPHWQVLVLALRGSSGGDGPGEERFTQKGLAGRTGLRPARISTLVRELNASASARLDAYVPSWRQGVPPRAAPPVLIEQFRGAVAGRRGVWTYYRLTPEGDLLARAVQADLDSQNTVSADLNSG